MQFLGPLTALRHTHLSTKHLPVTDLPLETGFSIYWAVKVPRINSNEKKNALSDKQEATTWMRWKWGNTISGSGMEYLKWNVSFKDMDITSVTVIWQFSFLHNNIHYIKMLQPTFIQTKQNKNRTFATFFLMGESHRTNITNKPHQRPSSCILSSKIAFKLSTKMPTSRLYKVHT